MEQLIEKESPEGKERIVIGENEHIKIRLHDTKTGNRRYELEIELLGKTAQCTVKGVLLAQGSDEKAWTIKQFFAGEAQTGAIAVHGVGQDASQIEINATALIGQSSAQATAEIEERVILFDAAKAKALPVLRVETDDVAGASHAASVAPIDENILLYFAARGVALPAAKDIITRGFLSLS